MSALLSNDAILQLTFQQLRRECKKADLNASGSRHDLRSRLQDWVVKRGVVNTENQGVKREREADDDDDVDDDEGPPDKRPKKSPSDDLICPITLELTWEPVSADDGRIYEKEAIEEHIKTQRSNGAALKSPVTNEPMGDRLVPLLQQKSLIETLIENGVIQGDLASAWKKKVKQAKTMEELQQKANSGDIIAIRQMARNYRGGLGGFKMDKKIALQWRQKGHDGGCFKSTALLGDAFFHGSGVTKCKSRGIMYTTMAAAQGSDFAACRLGERLASGNGIPQDKKEAIRWLKKALSPDCPLRHMAKSMEDTAKAKLEELLNENVAGGEPEDMN